METSMFANIILFILGLILLYIGAEFLVRGSSRLALLARIPPIIIGLTVVAFGTSFPEFVTSMVAAWQDKIDLAIGNIVGSNIANICLILGISGIIIPITIDPTTVKKELYWMMAASILFWIFGLGGTINHLEGAVLFAGIFAFTLIMIRNYLAMTVGGIILLMFGSNWLIESATNIARALGVSDVVIGLSLVAFGTSLPELATAIIAIVRKENEILLGNIVGSNIFNILFARHAHSKSFSYSGCY
jgi:cation:H+ antiporter